MPVILNPIGAPRRPVKAVLDRQTGAVLVMLDKTTYGFYDRPVLYQGRVFQPKSELHISILVEDAAEAVRRYLEMHPEEGYAVAESVDFARWTYTRQRKFYRVEESPGVETIIQMVKIPGLEAFLQRMSQQIGRGFLLPPTHVTLYTRGTQTGIALPNQERFRQLVKESIAPDDVLALEDRPAGLSSDQGLAR